MPGSSTLCPATLMASEATTKNQPPETDIIMFHTRLGSAKGTSSCQKLCHGDRWYMRDDSRRSCGTQMKAWYRLNVMFQACEVKIAKMAAHSYPSSLPGKSAMKPVTVIDRKPRIGTDWRMSSTGMSSFSARRLLAASAA